ncbi:MAG: dUTP diphosphatase [Clostridia bacterium]|nr:dUTP diphosphatase [Clostridia bacterium]
MKIPVKIKLTRGMEAPTYATDGSAAVDLRAALDEGTTVTIAPGERALIPTGIAIAPESSDVVAILAPRSGLACKKGIRLSNGIGVIDADYRGEIGVSLHNTGHEDFVVARGDRIAQMMFMPVYAAAFAVCDELDETARGAGGFGSTGTK